jgi:hypothetical protein
VDGFGFELPAKAVWVVFAFAVTPVSAARHSAVKITDKNVERANAPAKRNVFKI